MNASFFHQVSQDGVKLFRIIEKCQKKIINAQSAISFNNACINNKLWPNHTNIRTPDPALQSAAFVTVFKEKQLRVEIKKCDENLKTLNNELITLQEKVQATLPPNEINHITECLADLKKRYVFIKENEILAKLNILYGGRMCLPSTEEKYINLSQTTLTEEQRKFLNLGMNCHLESTYDLTKKKLQLELLYQSVLNLAKEDLVTIDEGLANALRSEGHKNRSSRTNSILDPKLKKAAAELKLLQRDKQIVIRKADKSCNYVIMDYNNYKNKIDNIISDTK